MQGVWEGRLASYYTNQIRTHPSEIYGDGFKAALEAFQRHGLRKTLLCVKKTGALPPHDASEDDADLTAKQQMKAALQHQGKEMQ